jgi:hypothetical protein
LASPLKTLLDLINIENEIPQKWQIADVTPLYKKNPKMM